ncbi:serine hydrolase domain-containing protein [Paenibacillus agricola]|nr:serine hydrolase domain-containing protein [Paenibacillus agricola]
MLPIEKQVQTWVELGNIPGAVLEVSLGGQFAWHKSWGSYSDGRMQRPITRSTIFDAASLTKVTATLPAILLLAKCSQLSLDDKVQRYIPGFLHEQVTLRQLLQHTSGLPADLPRIDRYEQRDVIQDILQQELVSTAGTQVLYSDLGFILLGAIIEELTQQTISAFVEHEVFTPLGMRDSRFQPVASLRERIAATEADGDGFIVGAVHDEKCFQLGGASGSAGLFTTAADLVQYAKSWLTVDDTLLSRRQRQECVAAPFQGRGLGWEVWQGQSVVPSCSAAWPIGSYGHTGFTGTSIWIEPRNELIVVFMTNAIHYGRSNPIRQLRPLLHEAIYSSLIGD